VCIYACVTSSFDFNAGSVYYDVTNFLEKNKDAIHADTKSMVLKSSVPFVAALMADKADSAG